MGQKNSTVTETCLFHTLNALKMSQRGFDNRIALVYDQC